MVSNFDFLVDTESEQQEVALNNIIQHLKYLQCMFFKYFSHQENNQKSSLVKDIPNKMASQDLESFFGHYF
jgi:uncharacterized protein YgfB (UPF0149 family)